MIARRLAALGAAIGMVAAACAVHPGHHAARPSMGASIQARAGDAYEVIYNPRTGAYTAEAKNGGPSYSCAIGNDSARAAFSVEVDGREVDCLDN